jgi:hypothetical protein
VKSFYKYPIPRPDGYENLIEVPNIKTSKTSRYVQKSQYQTKMKEFLALSSSHPTPPSTPGPAPLGEKPWVNKKFLGENWSLTLISDQRLERNYLIFNRV